MLLDTTKSKSGKISKSHILNPPLPKGYVISGKCEQPLDKQITVQILLLYDNPNFKYCTLSVSETELRINRTHRQTDKQKTDQRKEDPITRYPQQTLHAGGIKTTLKIPK